MPAKVTQQQIDAYMKQKGVDFQTAVNHAQQAGWDVSGVNAAPALAWGPQQESLPAKAWRVANTPAVDLIYGQGRTKRGIGNIGGAVADVVSLGQAPTEANRDFANEARIEREASQSRVANQGPSVADVGAKLRELRARGASPQEILAAGRSMVPKNNERTWSEAAREFAFGAGDSAEDVVSSLISPLGFTTGVLGRVTKGAQALNTMGKAGSFNSVPTMVRAFPEAVSTLGPYARAGEVVTGAAFAGQGASEALTPRQPGESDADYAQRVLTGASTAFMGGAGVRGGLKAEPYSPKIPGRGSLASRVIPESGGTTRGEVYNTMRDAGVDVNVAQAGGGKFARFVDDASSRLPGGAGRAAKFREKQSKQFSSAMEGMKDRFDPTGAGKDTGEQGAQLQRALQTAQGVSHDNARNAFVNELQPLFDYTTANTGDIVTAAQELKNQLSTGEIKSMHPELIGMLDEVIQGYGDTHNNKSMFDSLFRDRSRLMKSRFSDANVVGENEGAARRLADVMRSSLENAAAGAGKLDQFNSAMKGWQDYHEMWGDKTSPLVRAMNNPNPAAALDSFISSSGGGSARAVEMLKSQAPDFVNMLKREFVRRLQDPVGNGLSESQGLLYKRLLKYNQPFVKSLFTPEEFAKLKNLTLGAQEANIDINPSGSGKYQGQTAATLTTLGGGLTGVVGMAMHDPVIGAIGAGTAVGAPVLSNAAQRVIQNRPLTDFMMGREGASLKTPRKASPSQAPSASGGRAIPNPFGERKGLSNPARRKASGEGGFAVSAAIPGAGWIGDLIGGSESPSKSAKVSKAISEKLDPLAKNLAAIHNKEGGATYNLADGNMVGKDAFAVSAYPELQTIVESDKITPDNVKQFLSRPEVQDVLKSDPRVSVGTWAEGGKTYLDLVATPSNFGEARKLGATYDQKAIYDLLNGREVATGGSGSGKLPEGAPAPNQRLAEITEPGEIDAIHYSGQEGLTELDPSKFGSSGITSEQKIAQAYPGQYKPVSFLGDRDLYHAQNERNITSRPNRYGSKLNRSRYYDIESDPDGMIQKATKAANDAGNYGSPATMAYLQDVLRKEGYSGTINSRTGVVTSWDKVQVSPEPREGAQSGKEKTKAGSYKVAQKMASSETSVRDRRSLRRRQ